MKIRVWTPEMTDKETADLAYWERNVLALYFAESWFNDDVHATDPHGPDGLMTARFPGWRRVLSLEEGAITFHIPDDFDVGTTPQIEPNWDGHTTHGKWKRMLGICGVKVEE